MVYERTGRMEEREPQARPAGTKEQPPKEQIRVHGFLQVVEMLQVADAEFRRSLLRRIEQQDPALAQAIYRELQKTDRQ